MQLVLVPSLARGRRSGPHRPGSLGTQPAAAAALAQLAAAALAQPAAAAALAQLAAAALTQPAAAALTQLAAALARAVAAAALAQPAAAFALPAPVICGNPPRLYT